MSSRYTVAIPVLNQLHYTRQCVDSLVTGGVPADRLLVIDNASTDDTPQWLAGSGLRQRRNPVNLGFGGAWAQACFLGEADWLVLLNNDTLAAPGAIGAMLDAADREALDVVSPGLLEGDEDYGFADFAPRHVAALAGTCRRGWFHGVCVALHQRALQRVGFPDTERGMWGHEDKEYLVRCLRAGVPVGTVGGSVLHHFGSITQQAMKREQGVKKLGDHRHAYRRMGLGWWQRRAFKRQQREQTAQWSREEAQRCGGLTLHMLREAGRWRGL